MGIHAYTLQCHSPQEIAQESSSNRTLLRDASGFTILPRGHVCVVGWAWFSMIHKTNRRFVAKQPQPTLSSLQERCLYCSLSKNRRFFFSNDIGQLQKGPESALADWIYSCLVRDLATKRTVSLSEWQNGCTRMAQRSESYIIYMFELSHTHKHVTQNC